MRIRVRSSWPAPVSSSMELFRPGPTRQYTFSRRGTCSAICFEYRSTETRTLVRLSLTSSSLRHKRYFLTRRLMRALEVIIAGFVLVAGGPASIQRYAPLQTGVPTVAATPTTARATDGKYISWREHLIDDEATRWSRHSWRRRTEDGGSGQGRLCRHRFRSRSRYPIRRRLERLYPHRIWHENPGPVGADNARAAERMLRPPRTWRSPM